MVSFFITNVIMYYFLNIENFNGICIFTKDTIYFEDKYFLASVH